MKRGSRRISSAKMASTSGTQEEELMKGIVSAVEIMLKARDQEAFINEARYKDLKRCTRVPCMLSLSLSVTLLNCQTWIEDWWGKIKS